MTTIHEMAQQVQDRTGVAVTNKSIVSALELSGKTTGRTVLPDDATLEVVIAALAKTNPLLASASAAPADPPAPTATPAPVEDLVTEGDFVEAPLVTKMKPAAVVSAALELTVAEVLVYGAVMNGDGSSLVDEDLVRENWAATLAAADSPETQSTATGLSRTRIGIAQAAMLTSDHTRTDRRARQAIKAITDVAIRLWKVMALAQQGEPFRPELTAVYRYPETGELVHCSVAELPERMDVLYYEYESPLRKGWTIRLRRQAYLRLRRQSGESFPLYTPRHLAELVGDLSATALVTDTCAACGKYMNPLLESKVMKLLNGEHFLRGQGKRVQRELEALGYDSNGVTEIHFKRKHTECTALLKRMEAIVNSMGDADLDDPEVLQDFLQRVQAEAGEVLAELRQDSRNRQINRQLLLVRSADILEHLEGVA